MKLEDLRGLTLADDQIDRTLRSTEEYQQVASDSERELMYVAGMLMLRGDTDEDWKAIRKAFSQRAVVTAMNKELVDTRRLTWVPSGPISGVGKFYGNDFVQFLTNNKQEFNLNASHTTLNCWEAILVGAMLDNVISHGDFLRQLYTNDVGGFARRLVDALVSGATRVYDPGLRAGRPVSGDIVLFSGLDHVAIATGNNDAMSSEIYSFWPAPAVNDFGPRTETTVQRTTIEAIGAWLNIQMPNHPVTITFGSPSWTVLNGDDQMGTPKQLGQVPRR